MKPVVLAVTNGETTSFDALGRQIERFVPGFTVRVLPHNKVDSGTICDVLLMLWWRPLSEGILGRVTVRKSVVLAVFDHHSWSFASIYSAAMGKAVGKADYLAVGNEQILDQLRAKYDIPPAWVCETGVDTTVFRAAHLPQHFTALWCGNSRAGENDLKGLQIVKDAVALAGVPLIIADTLGEQGDAVPYAQMPEWYRQGSVLLVGSRSEGTPRTLLEAMACGRLAVSTRVGIAPRLIQHGVTGAIVDRDPQAMAAGLRYLKNMLLTVDPSIPRDLARASAEAFDVRHKIGAWRACLMAANSGKWWKQPPASAVTPAAVQCSRVSSEVAEIQGSPMPAGECQKIIDERDPKTAGRPTVRICSAYRFLARTLKLLSPMMDRYRFEMDDGTCSKSPRADIVWSLYPFADGHRALRISQDHMCPFVLAIRGSFGHLGASRAASAVDLYGKCSAIVSLTKNLATWLTAHNPALGKKITIIPNGGYSGCAPEAPAVLPYRRPLIAMLTNFNFEGKRVAAEQLAQAFERKKFAGSFLIAGREGLFAPPRGRFYGATYLGFVKDKFALLSAADVFIYHSHHDGQPSSLIEAMSVGLPVAVGKSQSSGALEFVQDGVTGVVREDVGELISEAVALTADKQRALRLGSAAAEYVRTELTWEAAADKHDKLFQSLLPARKRRSSAIAS